MRVDEAAFTVDLLLLLSMRARSKHGDPVVGGEEGHNNAGTKSVN